MDPMIDLVRERTEALQRTADSLRRDRDLRHHGVSGIASIAGPVASPTRLTAGPEACPPCATDKAHQPA